MNGAVIRIDPDTGAAWPTNPQASNPDPEVRKIIAFGLRNPYRLTLRPGTGEAWVGDVGSHYVEEINRVVPGAPVENFGWPCYEGDQRQPTFDSLDLTLCEQLYTATSGNARPPYYGYCHTEPATEGGPCRSGSGAVTGLDFYTGGTYPTNTEARCVRRLHTRRRGPCSPAATGCPTPRRWKASSAASMVRSTCVSGPMATSSTWTSGTESCAYLLGQPGVAPIDNTGTDAIIDSPTPDTTWAVGDTVAFRGHRRRRRRFRASAIRAALVVQRVALLD